MLSRILITLGLAFTLGSCSRQGHEHFQGYIEAENIYLASPYFGNLIVLNVVRGEQVKKGQLLFKLDPNPQEINISQVMGELEQAKNTLADLQKPRRLPEITAIEAQIEQTNAQIELATIRVDRFQKLYNKKVSDKDSLDAAIANLEQQKQLKEQYEANLALAKLGGREDQIKAQNALINSLTAKLKQAQWELDQKSIFAPESGMIFDTYYRSGEFVASQQPVVSLLVPQNIRVEFFVPLEYVAELHLGQKISFTCEGCKEDNPAVINYISPEVEYIPPLVYATDNYSKLVFRVKANIINASAFKPGQPVTVNL
ncbi:MAG: HlyD family efflux transporter periplasmic adaptor subunit [Legionella sp.]|nr:MAG: HlyD family efflux transporter periplasmic adaptor subunit [Legionella sp.]